MLATLALFAATIQNPLAPGGPFPVAVWLQNPNMAKRYRAAGFNLYVGLWQGPTEAQLTKLKEAFMPVICEQNDVGLRHLNDPAVVAWMHGDEPDNAQPAPGGGYGPCVPPSKVVADYHALKRKDPRRPVLLNLGQGVANDAWIGRGAGAKLSDYETYVQGCDFVSFDVYPVAGLQRPDQLGLVAKGVDRLMKWTGGKKRVWNCLECTDIDGRGKPTPAQVAAEAWSALIHGSRGLIYFVHQFKPRFNEHALLDDPTMLAALTQLNAQVQRFAPLLDDPVDPAVSVVGSGIESKVTRRGKETTLYIVALGRGSSVTVKAPHGVTSARDLLQGGDVGLSFTAAPLRPYILRVTHP